MITWLFQKRGSTICTYIKIKIQLDKEEEEETLKKEEKKELHSDCSLYESWPRETYVRTYICTFDRMIEWKPQIHCRSNSKKQLGDITIDTPLFPPFFPTILYKYTVFVSHCAAPPIPPSTLALFCRQIQIKLKINQPNKRNFDKMSFTMKS